MAARERERTIVELWLRGATFDQIGQKLGIDRSTAYRSPRSRVLKRLPKADIEALRKAQGERLQRMRGKVWSELSSTGDPELINALTGTLLRRSRRARRTFSVLTLRSNNRSSPGCSLNPCLRRNLIGVWIACQCQNSTSSGGS